MSTYFYQWFISETTWTQVNSYRERIQNARFDTVHRQ